jgi:hypothetical protein
MGNAKEKAEIENENEENIINGEMTVSQQRVSAMAKIGGISVAAKMKLNVEAVNSSGALAAAAGAWRADNRENQ